MKGQTFHVKSLLFYYLHFIRLAMDYAATNSTTMKTVFEIYADTHSHELFINSKGTKGEISNDLAGIIDVMNQKQIKPTH